MLLADIAESVSILDMGDSIGKLPLPVEQIKLGSPRELTILVSDRNGYGPSPRVNLTCKSEPNRVRTIALEATSDHFLMNVASPAQIQPEVVRGT
jgi:hypothetical protein